MAKCVKCEKKSMFLKVNDQGLCINCALEDQATELKDEIVHLKDQMSDPQKVYDEIKEKAEKDGISAAQEQIAKLKLDAETEMVEKNKSLDRLRKELSILDLQVQKRKKKIIELDEEELYQDFGLYKPSYNFTHSDHYKIKLDAIRDEQKKLIKEDKAVHGLTNWTVNGKVSEGKRMVKNTQKLVLRAFNSECDYLVANVKYNNYDSYLLRMHKSCEAISKLGTIMGIRISDNYLHAKEQELILSFEYQMKKKSEKEEQKELRAQMREEARLIKEIEDARKKTAKEKLHYSNELSKLKQQLNSVSDDKKDAVLKKINEMEMQLTEIEKAIKDIDYREANQRAGYVYIISNIGSFGENVFKIGMTRRLEPLDRIYELSDASVPFNFDVHAMLFSDDAPKLEAALHRAFEPHKVNLVNQRREFFNVPLDQIKEEVRKNYDKIVDFTEVPEAEQYRVSMKMKESRQ